ncbi:DHH family phosphoesterase [Mesobacillus foraminis]|uniref:Oligoribonuclease NrnB C-terminal domain-containing protein n=1 Tax=Mesobacillus foraminis TaxID=279826 RepID=A0A4R2BG38_9BACI|nr:oligoribonuclease [Mesobacillus foraminis]TCN24919.1 hypothetical protein EV146_106120 [Mesobacillus foraminis]
MFYLFTHNDLDGVGCGILARLAYGNKAEIKYNSVGGLEHQLERFLERAAERAGDEDFLCITDLSVGKEMANKLTEYESEGKQLQLIDHHKTALYLNEFSWGEVTVSDKEGRLASATSLFYEYLLKRDLLQDSGGVGEFVELVRQYDTWEWDQNNNQKAKQLNDLFFLVSIEEFEKRMVERLAQSSAFEFDDFESRLLQMEAEKIERYIRRKGREIIQTFIGNYCTGIVHAESYHSELGNELGKEHSHLDYIAILNLGGKKISYRTIHDNIDVSAIAGKFGGGGHAKASGSPMDKEAFRVYIEEVFAMDPIRPDASRNLYNIKESGIGTLYETRQGETFFIYLHSGGTWRAERNGSDMGHEFSSFIEAERHLKRKFSAYLARDEAFVNYLARHYVSGKK